MGAKEIELVLLAVLSAFLCGTAFFYEQLLAMAIFAALTSMIGIVAVGLRTFS